MRQDMQPFARGGNWYKGNLHTHTTRSDGRRSPEEVVALYRRGGYDFLALTDHRLYGYGQEFSSEDFLLIPGMEMDLRDEQRQCDNHLVVLRSQPSGRNYADLDHVEPGPWQGRASCQRVIDALAAHDNYVIYCHPVWSRCELEDFVGYDNLLGLEIFNYGCAVENRTGLADLYWDSLLRRGKRVWGFATDDSHQAVEDFCGGYIMVQAEALTEQAIVQSIAQGRFYSSTGPEVIDWGVADGKIYLRCSPARSIHFVAYERHGQSFHAPEGGVITQAELPIDKPYLYVRAEVEDHQGRVAWTNPIFL